MAVTIVNVSLPQMQGTLGASHEEISWVITLNIVATGIALPLCGWLVARFGERAVLLGSVAGFSVTSLMCGMADSLATLILYRVLQGAFGAPLVPVPQALLLSTYPPARHGVVLAIYSVGAIVGPVCGPIIGGFLTEHYNWRWAFFALVPPSIVAFAFTCRFIWIRCAKTMDKRKPLNVSRLSPAMPKRRRNQTLSRTQPSENPAHDRAVLCSTRRCREKHMSSRIEHGSCSCGNNLTIWVHGSYFDRCLYAFLKYFWWDF